MVAAIIQARMGSTRLPGKVLMDINGKPLVQRVIDRVKYATLVDKIILATTLDRSDNKLADLGKAMNVDLFRGSRDDVLDRYYQVANTFGVDVIARITADCPLIDPSIIDQAITTFLDGDYDYVSTAYPDASFPDGLDVCIFSICTLEKAWKEALMPSEREHVTPYIWKNPRIFRTKNIKHTEDLSAMRWTVDEESDLEFVREVYHSLDDNTGSMFYMSEILDLINKHPEILKINQGIERNKGYHISLKEDKQI